MKSKAELQDIIDQIAAADSPVGMDAVYVHALILEKLNDIEQRLTRLEGTSSEVNLSDSTADLTPNETNPGRLR